MKFAKRSKGLDPTGFETLERMAEAKRFNRWMYETIRPFCKGHVLEVGSGIGNISKLFLEDGFRITTSDLRPEYLNLQRSRLGQYPNLASIVSINLIAPHFTQAYSALINQFETVVALNVVEHIEDDKAALQNCFQMLKPGGHVVILVPAFQGLYNEFDKELGHFRRYTKRSLGGLITRAGFDVIAQAYFNTTGILGWFVNGRLRKKKIIPSGQLQVFDKLMPLVKLADVVTFRSVGLSVITVGRKP